MKAKALIWITVIVVLLPLAFNYIQTPSEHEGIHLPLALFGLVLVIFALIATFGRQREKTYGDASIASKTLKFFFIPGAELFGEDMKKALERPNAAVVSKCAMIVLIAIVFVSGLLSFPTILQVQYPGLKEWHMAKNANLWVGVYVLAALWFIIFTTILNALVWIAIRQGYHVKVVNQLESVIDFFKVSTSHDRIVNGANFWSQLSGHLEHVYGHKTWGGPKMYDLLNKIQVRKTEMGTSQWFLLQFAADALDHHVLDDTVGITFTYKDDDEYSKFLADSMGYCNQSMLWIVDREDFHKKLFPLMVQEVTFSIAAELASTNGEEKISQNLEDLHLHYAAGKSVHPHSSAFCEKYCNSNFVSKCKNSIDPLKECKYTEWKEVLDQYTKCWVNEVLENKIDRICNINNDNIIERCDDRKSDRFPYPHLRKYYEHPVPKARIIEIPNIEGWELLSNEERSKELLSRLAEHSDITCSENDNIDALATYYIQTLDLVCLKENDDDSNELQANKRKARRYIFLQAWELFKYLTNSDTNHKVVGFAMVEEMITRNSSINPIIKNIFRKVNEYDRFHLDIGIYDRHVMVNSMSGKGREVSWSILPETNVFAELDPLRKGGYDKVLLLNDFVTFLEGANRDA